MRILSAATLILATALLPLSALAAETGTLTVHLSGLKSAEGTVRVALFQTEADYAAGKMAGGNIVAADVAGVTTTFANLKPGDYALKIFHDLNGNETLDANLLGIPTEPFAFSNNATGTMGPASWADAHFSVTAGETTQSITLE